MNLTRGFVDVLLELRDAAAEPAALRVASDLVTDGLAVAALGARETGPGILASLAIESKGPRSATLIGHGKRCSGPEAARVNGAAMHVLDYEPMWDPANHSLSTTLPALLAAAEMSARGDANLSTVPPPTGKQILCALSLGIEAQQRIRLASNQLEPGDLGFHPPGAVGAFGSAIACGVLLNLGAAALAQAVGISASRACGIQGNVGSMTKALHCGQAALSGLESALMAARGFTADSDAMGGPRGYGNVFYGSGFEPEKLVERRSALFVVEPGPAFKFYPSQFGTHFVITAAVAARKELLEKAQRSPIRRVCITIPPMPYVDRPLPPTGLAGKFSFQYTAALALLDGEVGVQSFTDHRRFDSDVVAMLDRISIEVDPERDGRFYRMKVDVEVELDNGHTVRAGCDGPPGVWGRPAERSQLLQKAHRCLEAASYRDRAESIVRSAQDFAFLEAPDIVHLLDRLASPDVPE